MEFLIGFDVLLGAGLVALTVGLIKSVQMTTQKIRFELQPEQFKNKTRFEIIDKNVLVIADKLEKDQGLTSQRLNHLTCELSATDLVAALHKERLDKLEKSQFQMRGDLTSAVTNIEAGEVEKMLLRFVQSENIGVWDSIGALTNRANEHRDLLDDLANKLDNVRDTFKAAAAPGQATPPSGPQLVEPIKPGRHALVQLPDHSYKCITCDARVTKETPRPITSFMLRCPSVDLHIDEDGEVSQCA